ncbi:precorrin-3B C(17)-methyltransferase [Polycladidibacter stylochi]|uniref:precorrin-3B C(17)-methyltransferase n=1 Tax=Polycladidibacter stylochi TaxID=1807766 RepID=UPI00082C1ADF|nr:precorrin-3B C(17)-methyltransferase [Pseudovibrio stylochi]
MDAAPALIVINPSALQTAKQINGLVKNGLIHGFSRHSASPQVEYNVTFSDASSHLRGLFQAGTPIIGVCASGILIRALAPVLGDKHSEPPVIAVSDDGKSVVPLLGGHRGANELACKIAEGLQSHAAITTSGDNVFGIALDDPADGYTLANPKDAKGIMANMLCGEPVQIIGEAPWLQAANLPLAADAKQQIIITTSPEKPSENKLVFHPQTHVVGLGCARGCALEELEQLVLDQLETAGIAMGAVAAFASIDVKADEQAMLQLASKYNRPFRVFSPQELEAQAERLRNPSSVVFAEVGCHGVSEGAALAATGANGKLLVEKQKTANATMAVACAPAPVQAENVGRAPGRLHVIGIGPGRDDWRTPQASKWLGEADEVVGYSLYLDLVAPLINGKHRHAFPLGAEEERVRFALERAGTGKNVALVCSGDSGIYAMGALVFELLDRAEDQGGVSAQARRVEVASTPGVSAMVALSNRIGAPLGHDFCAISLSDLLTPWETIQKRVIGAAQGDFVIGFYNPVSMRRRTQLAWARDTLLQHRPATTPVVLGSNIGRPEEKLTITTLEKLEVDQVDMLTTVLVGCSQTKAGAQNAARPFVYTPRGYAKRIDAPKEVNASRLEDKQGETV